MLEWLGTVLSPEFVDGFVEVVFTVAIALPFIFLALAVLTPVVTILLYIIGGLVMVVTVAGTIASAVAVVTYRAVRWIVRRIQNIGSAGTGRTASDTTL